LGGGRRFIFDDMRTGSILAASRALRCRKYLATASGQQQTPPCAQGDLLPSQVVVFRLHWQQQQQQKTSFLGNATTTTTTITMLSARSYGIQAGYHRFFYPVGYPGKVATASAHHTKDAISVLVNNLRDSPVETAELFAKCLTPAERGAIIYALRTKSNQEGIDHLEEAFLEADSNMDGKLSREEFAAYLAVRGRAETASAASACRPTNQQLLTIAIASGIPFVGFGFCDNAIMLMSGERIESSLGVALGITTLAAAGLGNLISDVVGLGLADTIEVYARRFGVKEPSLNKEQLRLTITRGVCVCACRPPSLD
jgi:hypothetical protein